MSNGDAHIIQINDTLKTRYFPIVLQLSQHWTPEQHEKNRLSRSLAAFAIEKLADVAPAQAANAVFDAGNDNGIDAIHFDRINNRLWVIQAKAGNAPDMGENKKFCDGIRDMIAGHFHKFNAGFARLQQDVEDALATDGLIIIGGHVHLGDELGPHATTDLNQLKDELNHFVARFDWKDLKRSVVHSWLTREHAVTPVNIDLILENWYGIDAPRRSFYGLVSASQLAALYEQHKKALFEKNIRHYLGAQPVNDAIGTTVQDRPSELFYLNNGLTAVCASISPAPGIIHSRGVFRLNGFSIVNGAQTVGSIATVNNTTGSVSSDAKLLITLIEVGTAPDNLGPQITRARNTQNEVRGLYFAALDPTQERLRQELAVSGITYYYRPSAEATQGGPTVITLQQGAIALASFSGDTRMVVTAKKEIGQLYDQTGSLYPALFHGGLTGISLCRQIRVYQYLDNILSASVYAETDMFRRAFYRHGRFFILHILARRHRPLIIKPELTLSIPDQTELSRLTLELAETIYTVAEARFNRVKGYLSVFRNHTDSEPLSRDVMLRLSQQDAQRQATGTTPINPTTQTP